MPFSQHLHKGKTLLLLLCFCIAALSVTARPGDTVLVKAPGITALSFPELKQAPGSNDSSSFILPFSRVGNLLLVKAKADSAEGNFILDTGCPGLVLNITYFRNYAVSTEPDEGDMQAITGTSAAAEQVMIQHFNFGTIHQYNVKASLANLGNIENSKGVKILGLVGMQFLNNCEMIIDYQKNLVYFHVISRKEAGTYKHALLSDTAAYNIIPFEITENRIIVRTVMAGKKLRFVIDCAAETNILDSRLPDKVFETLSITGRVSLLGVGNKKVDAVKGSLAQFNIGSRSISNMPVLVTNLEQTCFSHGGCVDGVLGLDNLSIQKIGFNFVTLKMYIWK